MVLVGFDDIEPVALASVPMTSVKQTVESLLKRIRGQSAEPYITLQPELVTRASSLKPDAGECVTQTAAQPRSSSHLPYSPTPLGNGSLKARLNVAKRCSPH